MHAYPNVVKNHENDLCIRSYKGLTPLYQCRVGCVIFFRSTDSDVKHKLDGKVGHIAGFSINTWKELTFIVQLCNEIELHTVHPINVEIVG